MAWEAWKCYPDVTMAFTHMALNPYIELDTDSQYFRLLGRYTVVLYNKASELDNVDVARMELFCHGNKSMEKIPPTKVPFCSIRSVQHIKLVFGAPVTCQIRKGLLQRVGVGVGTTKFDHGLLWTTLPIASKAYAELIKCGCKSKNGCGARCGCRKANWMCTELCFCKCIK